MKIKMIPQCTFLPDDELEKKAENADSRRKDPERQRLGRRQSRNSNDACSVHKYLVPMQPFQWQWWPAFTSWGGAALWTACEMKLIQASQQHWPLRGADYAVVPVENVAPACCSCYCYFHSYLLGNFQYSWGEGIKGMGKNPALILPDTGEANDLQILPFIEVLNILKAIKINWVIYKIAQKTESQQDLTGTTVLKALQKYNVIWRLNCLPRPGGGRRQEMLREGRKARDSPPSGHPLTLARRMYFHLCLFLELI